MKDLFIRAAPLRKKFGVEPFRCVINSVSPMGEAFIHELCHVVTLEKHGVFIPLRPSYGSSEWLPSGLSSRLGLRIDVLSKAERAENECETLAVEVLLLEMNGHLDIRNDPSLLGMFLRDLWDGQPYFFKKRFDRSFKKFVLHILELRDTDWIRSAAVSVRRRVRYWRTA